MLIGAVADIHGNFDALYRAMARHDEVRLWMCVGDVASITGVGSRKPRAKASAPSASIGLTGRTC